MKNVRFKTSFGRFQQGTTHSVGNKSAAYFERRGVAEIIERKKPGPKPKVRQQAARDSALTIEEEGPV
jgi:hypothetical protein